jgi:hypothetical protein
MRTNRVPLPVLAAALSACVAEPELLNSERIMARFGSYGVDVLTDTETLRRSNLYSEQDGTRICRTYAVVTFTNARSDAVRDEHARIVAGESIGATFRAHGWQIFKETLYVGNVSLPSAEHPVAALMHIDGNQPLAMHVYRLLLRKGDTVIDYATITEAHHPDYLDLPSLAQLFDADAASPVSAELREHWKAELLGHGNDG